MKNKLLILVVLLFICPFVWSQSSKLIGSKIPLKDIGKSTLTVYYQYLDKSEKNEEREGITGLQVLKSQSRFFDLHTDRFIERQNELDKNELTQEDFQELMRMSRKNVFNKVIFKDFANKRVTIQDRIIGTVFQYEEPIPKLDWKIEKDKKIILGHDCQKASTKFRGRNYMAWFTTDIPISDGPYLFTGLPGLILEIIDSKGEYAFIANAVEKKGETVYLNIDTKIRKTDRSSFRRAQENDHLDPGAALQGKIYTGEGKVINTSGTKAIPYNPIELE